MSLALEDENSRELAVDASQEYGLCFSENLTLLSVTRDIPQSCIEKAITVSSDLKVKEARKSLEKSRRGNLGPE